MIGIGRRFRRPGKEARFCRQLSLQCFDQRGGGAPAGRYIGGSTLNLGDLAAGLEDAPGHGLPVNERHRGSADQNADHRFAQGRELLLPKPSFGGDRRPIDLHQGERDRDHIGKGRDGILGAGNDQIVPLQAA